MRVLDAFKGHLTDSVTKQLRKNTELVIPNRMTSVLQPMDVPINKPFKDRLRQQYLTWISDPVRELTETGKIKSAAPSEVARWVSAAWKAILESIIIRSFKKCCITLILRRSRTGTVWFYTSTSNKRAARPKLYTKSLTMDLKHMYSRLTLVRISINL